MFSFNNVLIVKPPNAFILLQPSVFRIALIGTRPFLAVLLAALLVECGENVLVSIPAFDKVSLIHLAIVSFEAGLKGLTWVMNSDFISPRFFEVMCKYCFKVVTGQILVFSIYFGNFDSPLWNWRFEVFSKSPILIMRQVSSIVIFLMSINDSISRARC